MVQPTSVRGTVRTWICMRGKACCASCAKNLKRRVRFGAALGLEVWDWWRKGGGAHFGPLAFFGFDSPPRCIARGEELKFVKARVSQPPCIAVRTIFYATHIFDHLAEWATHLIFFSAGKVQRCCSMAEPWLVQVRSSRI